MRTGAAVALRDFVGLTFGTELESPGGVANCEEILAVPGLGLAEIGPGDLSLSLGYRTIPSESYPEEMQARAIASWPPAEKTASRRAAPNKTLSRGSTRACA